MRLFPGDLAWGALLSLAIIMILLGILVYRYRRGNGPILLAISGTFIAASSLLDLLSSTEVFDIGGIVRWSSLVIGIVLGVGAILLWRR